MDLGVQLYGAMDLFREDPDEFLEKLSQAGYTNIEPVVAFGTDMEEINKAGMKPVWLPEETAKFRELAKAHNLGMLSCHVFGDPITHLNEIISMAVENQIGAIVLNCRPCGDDAEFEQFTGMCLRVSASLEKAGVKLWLHNGYPEIKMQRDGMPVYEAVLKACGGNVGAQADVGWVQYGGVDPISFLKRIEPYLQSVHYKDIKGDYHSAPPEKHFICLGEGKLDTAGIKTIADTLPVTQLVDQDASDKDLLQDLINASLLLGKI